MTSKSRQPGPARERFILVVTLSYGIGALLWILLSDRLISWMPNTEAALWISNAKGLFFVGVTTILLYFTLRSVSGRNGGHPVFDQLTAGLIPQRERRWLNYGLAVAVTVAMLLFRNALGVDYGVQPLLVLFVFPIILSAMLGGLGPGLLSTAIASGTLGYLMLLHHKDTAASSLQFLLWAFLVIDGIAVSVLSEAMRRAMSRGDMDRRLLEVVITGTTQAIYVKDKEGRYRLANGAAAAFMRAPVQQVLDSTDFDLLPASMAREIAQADRDVMENRETRTFEQSLQMPNGKTIAFLVTKGPVLDHRGEVVGVFGISQEITERKVAERELVESRSAMQEAQRLSGVGSWSVNLEDGSTTWSAQLASTFHLPSDAPAPSYDRIPPLYTPESWRQIEAAMRTTMADGIPYEVDAEIIRADGTQGWVIARGEAVRNEAGKITTVRGTIEDITQRKQAEIALRNAQRMAKVGDWSLAVASREMTWSEQAALIFTGDKASPSPHIENMPRFFAAQTWKRIEPLLMRAIEHGEGYEFDAEVIRPDGSRAWVTSIATPVLAADGKVVALHGMVQDITERKAIEEEMRKLAQAVEQSPESILITDLKGNIEYVNAAFTTISGYSRDEVVGKNPRFLRSGKTSDDVYASLWSSIAAGRSWQGEFHNRRKDGSVYIQHAIISPISQSDGEVTHYLAVQEDITEKKQNEAKIHQLINYDLLTDLPNRTLLLDHIARSIATDSRNLRHGALIMFNVDRFKSVNDVGGQAMGDELLRMVAKRLAHNLREGDVLARIAGDEFGVLITDLAARKEVAANLALHVAEKIHGSLSEMFNVGSENIALTASLGIALFPDTREDNSLDVLRRANTALHHAKRGGGGQTSFFEAGLDDIAKQRFAIEHELRLAVAADDLRVYLQPQVTSASTPAGAEALVRWQHPQRGLVMPGAFIPIAEESDLIVDIGNWVLTRVCHLLAREHALIAPMRISVNISARHFRHARFVQQVRQVLATTGADPARLTLEVTEGMLIENVNDVVAKMNELNEIGVHFSLDDFGTGYSSLSYLKRLPIHEIKIDKTFVQDMTTDGNDASLVETILSIARHLNLMVVAEGVETAEQAEFLNQRGQVIHQGYFFGKPEPEEVWLGKLRRLKQPDDPVPK